MGLVKELVLLPLAPLRGVVWTLERVVETAEEEQRRQIRRELADLERALLAGTITEAEFDRREDQLLDRLGPDALSPTPKGTT